MKLKSIIVAVAFMATPAIAFAQSTKADEQLSEELKNQISILKADIKALKARKKADPTNPNFVADINAKNEELKETTRKKKIIDNAIKANKKNAKETKQAESANKKNEKAQKEADKLRTASQYAGKSNELISDELDKKIDVINAEIKALKARKKADPKNITILSELSQKQTELKENKRHKKIFDNAISASNKAQKETKQAEKAKEKLEDAMEKRNEL